MSRLMAATEASVRAISSSTMAGSVSIGAGAPPAGGAAGPSAGGDGMKSPRSTMVCSASPINGSDLPRPSTRPCAARRRRQLLGDVDEQSARPPRASVGPPSAATSRAPTASSGRSSSAGGRRRRRRGSSPSLAAGIGNSVVIGRLWTIWKSSSTRHHSMSCGRPKCASMRRPSCTSRTTCASVSAGCSWRSGSIGWSCVPPAGEAWMARCLAGDRLGDDVAVAHLEDVRVDQARDQRLAQAEAGLHGGDPPVARDRVGGEEDAGRLREDHPLHDHRHVDRCGGRCRAARR